MVLYIKTIELQEFCGSQRRTCIGQTHMGITITMQGWTLTAITATEKCTLMLESTNHDKVTEAWNLGQGH